MGRPRDARQRACCEPWHEGVTAVTMAALATATGRKRTTDLSVLATTIKKGLVYPPERLHRLTVPGW